MSLKEVQDLLARLCTDADLREKFLNEPTKIGDENDLNEKEIEFLAQVFPDGLRFFADSLFHKRLCEVEKLLPLTRKVLGKEFAASFRNFSRSFQPASIKKHLEDAVKFAEYLQNQNLENAWFRELISFEQANLESYGYGKRFIFRYFRYDIRDVLHAIKYEEAKILSRRRTFGIWLLIGKTYQVIF